MVVWVVVPSAVVSYTDDFYSRSLCLPLFLFQPSHILPKYALFLHYQSCSLFFATDLEIVRELWFVYGLCMAETPG